MVILGLFLLYWAICSSPITFKVYICRDSYIYHTNITGINQRNKCLRRRALMDKKELAQAASSAASKALGGLGSGVSRLMPKGGIRHPDSLITQGPNRSLYLPSGEFVSPVPGARPVMGKSLLVGSGIKKTSDGLEKLREIQRPRNKRGK
jgi:hypothetical protein